MTKAVELQWKVPVPEEMQSGAIFDRWTEEKDSYELEMDCTFKVDDCGFFVFWKSEGKEGDVQELSMVNDIRAIEKPKDPKLLATLTKKHGENFSEKAFSICSGLDCVHINSMHVVCKDTKTAEIWKGGLRSLTNNVKANNVCPMTNLNKHWMRLQRLVTLDGKVAVKTIAKTFASGKTEKLVYETLAECGLPSQKNDSIEPEAFTFDIFYKIYQTICPRNDIDTIFKTLTKTETIGIPKMVQFMNEKMRDGRLNQMLYPEYDEKRLKQIIKKYEPSEDNVKDNVISKEGFTRYLLSDDNSPVLLDRLDIYQDMEQPLCHYYINSSHNTYLSGKQFGGKSNVEMYRQTLLAGCRCVELDCWDGDEKVDFEPIITHGKAMCTDIMFKDCVYAIRDCAFVTSDYPVILSLENHCCRSQQYKMAKYFDEIFGDLLLKEPLPDFPLVKGQPLPPPSRLKRKILLKNKRLKPEVEKIELEKFWKGELATDDDEVEDASAVAAPKPEETAPDAPPAPAAYTGATLNVHPYLSSMVNYTHPMKFQGFETAEEQDLHFKMSSFAETAALGYLKSQGNVFVDYNKRQFSRLYPKGSRVDSSNYMPQIFWNSGCQLVALNFQTPDLPMQLNQGKFEYNGNCGYCLKPEFMRRSDKEFDPFAETPVDGVIAAECNVTVISGQFLSEKKVGTYVEVDMYGLPCDTIRKENRTKVVPANGLNPQYDEEPFNFRKVVLPELAVLRFGVYDDSDKLLGQRILPFNDLQMGYRHIALRTEGNFPMALPMIFCNIEVKIYVPDGLGDFMDALSDPRAFLSAQDKRAEQLKAMGIEATEIDESNVIASSGDKKKKGGAAGAKKAKEEEEIKFDPITPDSLKREKTFSKVAKKQQKEIDNLKKKQMKELTNITKQQVNEFTKAAKGLKSTSIADIESDTKVMATVAEQTKQWTEMMKKHRKETWDLTKSQVNSQEDMLKKCMELAQANQIKELEANFEKQSKEMKAEQAKTSVETAKEVQNDPKLKTKAEKDRRLKEKNANNMKKIIEERKTMQMKQNKQKTKLTKVHETQMGEISKWIKDSIQECDNDEKEYQLANKREAFV